MSFDHNSAPDLSISLDWTPQTCTQRSGTCTFPANIETGARELFLTRTATSSSPRA